MEPNRLYLIYKRRGGGGADRPTLGEGDRGGGANRLYLIRGERVNKLSLV